MVVAPTLFICRLRASKVKGEEGIMVFLRQCSNKTTIDYHKNLAMQRLYQKEKNNLKLMKTPPQKIIGSEEIKKVIISSSCFKTPPPVKIGEDNNISAFTPYVVDSEMALENCSPFPSMSN